MDNMYPVHLSAHLVCVRLHMTAFLFSPPTTSVRVLGQYHLNSRPYFQIHGFDSLFPSVRLAYNQSVLHPAISVAQITAHGYSKAIVPTEVLFLKKLATSGTPRSFGIVRVWVPIMITILQTSQLLFLALPSTSRPNRPLLQQQLWPPVLQLTNFIIRFTVWICYVNPTPAHKDHLFNSNLDYCLVFPNLLSTNIVSTARPALCLQRPIQLSW